VCIPGQCAFQGSVHSVGKKRLGPVLAQRIKDTFA